MESGKISVTKTKKGQYQGHVHRESGGPLIVPAGKLSEKHNNKPCQYEMHKGLIVRLIVDGEIIIEANAKQNTAPQRPYNQYRSQGTRPQANRAGGYGAVPEDAKAPYNFVPLNDRVVPCPHQELKDSFGDAYNTGFLTGYIDCELETVTPLFIGQEQDRDRQGRSTDPLQFFNIDGKPRIPGSSLRGMVRNLIEIASWGKFTGINAKRKLYFRDVADSNSSLGKLYRELLQKGEVRSGILKKRGRKYIVEPSHPASGGTIFTVSMDIARSIGFFGHFNYKHIYFLPEERGERDFSRVRNLSLSQKPGYVEGVLVASGPFPKKRNHWIITLPKNGKQQIEIPEDVISNYKLDKSRKPEADLLEQLKEEKKAKSGVPCFYVQDHEGKVAAFGHTLYFRMPYHHSIGDQRPNNLIDTAVVDIPEALFGKEAQFATRLFFQDAHLAEERKDLYCILGLPRLESPKPTSYQLYLEQNSKYKDQLKHWDHNDARLRGYKLYWHKDISDKPVPGVIGQDANFQVRAINPRVKFKFRIRYDNLAPIELGALLFVLNLPDGLLHKLGMGKPVGLGSVKIVGKLVVSDRVNRYCQLFDGQHWATAEQQAQPQEYISEFERYILTSIGSKEMSLWDHPRMRALRTMLNWSYTKNPKWMDATGYMGVGKFKKQVLPTPEEVIKSFTS